MFDFLRLLLWNPKSISFHWTMQLIQHIVQRPLHVKPPSFFYFIWLLFEFYDLYHEPRCFLPAGILRLRVLMELVQPLAEQIDSLR